MSEHVNPPRGLFAAGIAFLLIILASAAVFGWLGALLWSRGVDSFDGPDWLFYMILAVFAGGVIFQLWLAAGMVHSLFRSPRRQLNAKTPRP